MIQKFFKNYPFIASLIFIFSSIQIIPYALNSDKSDNIVTKLMLEINYYPSKMIGNVKSRIKDSWENYIMLVDVNKENELLIKEVDNLRNEYYKLEELKMQNERLKDLLNYKDEHAEKVVSANVIAGSPSIIRPEFLMIDKGENSGVSRDMAVSTNLGVVGRVHSAGKNNSMIMLITDPLSSIDAIVHRTRERGIVKGIGNKCLMQYIENKENIAVGDKIISSGKDGIFPKGILIGTIAKIEPNGGLYEAVIEPEINTNTLEEVLIILEPKLETQDQELNE
ncbi:MAG: rod shape-determining protein MreC [Thermodesulfobacteriota bacterium]